MEDLDGLPFLDMVVKEVYRLNPSIPTTVSDCQGAAERWTNADSGFSL